MRTSPTKPPTIRLGHSPDADDAFMFYGLSHGKIDRRGLFFRHFLRDIETLNRWALEARLQVTAMSAHAYGHVHHRYRLLRTGFSMGEGYGPILVARQERPLESLAGSTIAVPGMLTTAYLLLRLALRDFQPLKARFDEILQIVKDGQADAGLLIHEGQLTYQQEGLCNIIDLGQWWLKERGLPTPLGVIGVRSDLPAAVARKVAAVVRSSLLYSFSHREEAMAYALKFASGLQPAQADRFIRMYANEASLDCGNEGQQALHALLNAAHRVGLIPDRVEIRFVT